jgi:hypothetical protein
MDFKDRKSLYRLFFFLHPSSNGSHPLVPILHPRFSILLLLIGILLVGAVINHAGGITQPVSKSQSANFDLHADAVSSNLKNDIFWEEKEPSSPPPLAVVEQGSRDNAEVVTDKQPQEPAKPDPPLERTPDLPPDVPMPESNPEPKILVDDGGPAKDLPDPPVQSTGKKQEPELTKEALANEEKPDEVKQATVQNTETEQQPDLDDTVRDLHRGDTPMRNTWRVLGLNTVLAAALTATPGLAADTDKLQDKDKQDLAEIKRLLEGISKSLESLGRMEREIEDLRFDRDVRVKSMQAEFSDLKKQVAKMREDMDRLFNADGSRRTAFSSPNATATTATGTIKFVSTYMDPVNVIVGDALYEVPPGQTIALTRPAGALTYEVPISGKKANRILAANETITVRIFPQ